MSEVRTTEDWITLYPSLQLYLLLHSRPQSYILRLLFIWRMWPAAAPESCPKGENSGFLLPLWEVVWKGYDRPCLGILCSLWGGGGGCRCSAWQALQSPWGWQQPSLRGRVKLWQEQSWHQDKQKPIPPTLSAVFLILSPVLPLQDFRAAHSWSYTIVALNIHHYKMS